MTVDERGPFWFAPRLQKMSPAQWLVAGLLLCAIVFLARWQHDRDLEARARVVAAFFELPDGVTYVDIQPINKSKRTSPSVAVVARFSSSDFKGYISGLDSLLWSKNIPLFGNLPVRAASPNNIKWRSLPVPASVGTSGVAWASSSADAVSAIGNGRMLCIALKKQLTVQGNGETPPSPSHFTARDCTDIPRTDEGSTLVLGALDLDTRTLYAMIK